RSTRCASRRSPPISTTASTCTRGRKTRRRTTRPASPRTSERRSMKVVVDWDGTVTVTDSLVAAVHALGDGSIYDVSLQETFPSYGDALAAEAGALRVTADELASWAVANVEIRVGFR